MTEPVTSPRLAAFAEAIRRDAGEMPAEKRAEGWRMLSARRERPVRRRRALISIALAAALSVALIASLRLRSRATALSYVLEEGELQGAGYVAPTSEGAKLRFSDGTRLELGATTRGRIAGVTHNGAQIALEDGEVHAQVIHRDDSQWFFHAGPFVIKVTGTAFDLRWVAASEHLELAMREGAVVVSGPVPAGTLTLSKNEKLTVRVRENEVLIRKLEESEPVPVDAPAPPAATEASGESAPAPPIAAPKAAEPAQAGQGLAQLLAAGKLDAILAKVEERGLDSFVSSASSEDLAALADAARYKRQDTFAKRALMAQRERFPRSARARDAAFFLGRIAEVDAPGAEALRWYDRYLSESPGGLYAGEALGRKLALVQRISGPDKARPIAEEYLRRFPDGSYAKAARTLLDTK
jgi:TolA-binding protein